MNITRARRIRPLSVCLAAMVTLVIGATVLACANVSTKAEGQSAPPASRVGYIVGSVTFPDGRPVPKFTIEVSGFADGQLAATNGSGHITETVVNKVNGTGGRYEVAVPAGAYRASGWTTVEYQGRTYNFQLENTSEPVKFDYDGLGLEKLRNGIVRNFKAAMTDRKKDALESDEMGYYHAFYGGTIHADGSQTEYQLGGGAHIPKSLSESYPAESKIEITLTPQGAMVDGTAGAVTVRTVRLGDEGKWTFVARGIYPGMYTATARLLTPDGQAIPIRVSLTKGRTELHPGGYDQVVMDWHPSVTVDFLPNDLGPMPRMGVKDVALYFGK